MNVMDECWHIHDRTKFDFIQTEIKYAHYDYIITKNILLAKTIPIF